MHELSTADGFVEISENLADMIKFWQTNPPWVFSTCNNTRRRQRLTYLISRTTSLILHTQDLEDSITMIGSMKECGIPIADEMIKELKNSLSIISTKQPKGGLTYNKPCSGFLGRTSSWSPATWGRNSQQGVEKTSGYLSSVFKSATKKAENFKWPQKEESRGNGENLSVDAPSLNILEVEAEDLPLSSQTGEELQEESELRKSLSNVELLSAYENYDELKADKESKFEEWLGGAENETGSR